MPTEIRIMHNVAGSLGAWIEKVEPLYAGETPRWREHPVFGRAVDVVALELTDAEGIDVHAFDPWQTVQDTALHVASPLSIVGFPFGLTGGGLFGVWVQGTVATEPDLDYDARPCFLIDSRTRPGQSGSPVIFYADGGMVPLADGSTGIFTGPVERLHGVYSGRINEQSDLGFVWKASVIREIVNDGASDSSEAA